jgi:hypothetical protein
MFEEYDMDWAQQTLARDAFWADTLDPRRLPVEDQELWHRFSWNAEQAELDQVWRGPSKNVVTMRGYL